MFMQTRSRRAGPIQTSIELDVLTRASTAQYLYTSAGHGTYLPRTYTHHTLTHSESTQLPDAQGGGGT